MKKIHVGQEHQIRLGYYKYTCKLFPGVEYLFYDNDAVHLSGGGVEKISSLHSDELRPYKGEDLQDKTLLYFCLGTYRDVLFDVPLICFLQDRFPNAIIDIVTHIDVLMLLQQFGFKGGWNRYPIPLEFAERYDYIFANEILTRNPTVPGRELREMYESILPDYSMFKSVPLSLMPSISKVTDIGDSGRICAAIHVNSEWPVKNYSVAEYKKLIKLLSKEDVKIIALGYPCETNELDDVENYVGKHSSILETLSVLSQVDLIIASDCFAARVGGILEKPTIVLLNTNDEEIYSSYPGVEVILSGDSCVPCYRSDKCPLGYSECQAFHHESISSEKIYQRALKIIQKLEAS